MKKVIFTILLLCCAGGAFYWLKPKSDLPPDMHFTYACDFNYVEKSEKCPPDKPFFTPFREIPFHDDLEKQCFGCNEWKILYPFLEKDRKEIAKCPERTLTQEGPCYKSILKVCPPEAPLRDHEGSCFSCFESERVYINQKSDCDVCPNRTFVDEEIGHDICALSICPDSAPLRDKFSCFSCDKPAVLNTTQTDCEKCPNRRWINGQCFLIMSNNPEKPLAQFPPKREDWEIALISHLEPCDTPNPIATVKESCDKCPNREYKDGQCILKDK
ncbi:MAG: hypothetical protein IKS41_05030 [Alphaproteobacteria bacterium]|nr:hypothetical protein [Alphaproteobacteria bacterium]